MFNNNNIINSTKNSNINAKNIILDDEKEISENRELKKSYTFKIIIIAICLLVYWIILMLIYEKDKKYILIILSNLNNIKSIKNKIINIK